MSNKTTDTKIAEAVAGISDTISETLLTMAPRLAKKYNLTQQQLAVAIVHANVQLMIGSVAGVVLGAGATDAAIRDIHRELLGRIVPIISAALGDRDGG